MVLGDLITIRNVADMIWLEVDFYQNCLDMDHRKMTFEGKTSKRNVESRSNISRNTFMDPKTNMNAIPKDWPIKVIAAYSMYRITRQMIDCSSNCLLKSADILGACLTSLPHVITKRCFFNSIKVGENCVS